MMSYNTIYGLSSTLSEDYILYFLGHSLSKAIHEMNFIHVTVNVLHILMILFNNM